MSELQEAIDSLRREVGAILAATRQDRPPSPPRTIRVSLGLERTAGGDAVWRPASGPTPHSMTLEWSTDAAPAAPADPAPSPAGTPSASAVPWSEADAVAVGTELDSVFGPPGFDAAARASVFRELAAEAGEAELRPVLEAITAGTPVSGDDTAGRARHGIARLLDRGPSGARAAAGTLARILSRHPLERVLEVIADRWRFGSG